MSGLRNALAVIAYVAAFVATIGAAILRPEVMGIAGIVAALAALGWGLLKALEDRRRRRNPAPFTTEVVHRPAKALTVIKGGKEPAWRDELPHRPDLHAPFWDTNIFGAPE